MSLDASTHQVNSIQGRIQEARKRLALLNTSLGIDTSTTSMDQTTSLDSTLVIQQPRQHRQAPAAPPVLEAQSTPLVSVSRSVSFVSVSQASTASSRPTSPPAQHQHLIPTQSPPHQQQLQQPIFQQQTRPAEVVGEVERSPSIEAVQMSPLASSPQPAPTRLPSSPTRVDRFRAEREALRNVPVEESPKHTSPSRAPSMSLDEMQDQLRRRIQNMQSSSRSTSATLSTTSNDNDHRVAPPAAAQPDRASSISTQLSSIPNRVGDSSRVVTPTATTRTSRPTSRATTPKAASRPTTPVSRTASRSTSRSVSRLPVSPPHKAAGNGQFTPEQVAEMEEGRKRSVKAALSGAEVFALLRLRGVIMSSGDTGERLLPPTRSHSMMLSEDEFQQLKQLRASLARQHR